MQHEIEVQNEKKYTVDEKRLIQAIVCTLSHQAIDSPQGVTVVITDDDTVRKLNYEFRGIDASTDVLSFPADEPPIILEDEPIYLGDLIISYPYTHKQTRNGTYTTADSLMLLVVHGTLHLLGYDHDTRENRAEMWRTQAEILEKLQVPQAVVPALEGYDHND